MAETPFPGQVLATEELANRLLAGSAALFPTDTVPALAAPAETVAQLWQLKQRPARKPMILMGADAEALFAALDVPIAPQWRAMAERCWPGAVTLVLPARGGLARALGGEGSSLGLRIPACPVALELLRRTGPLATTSANRSSEPPCRTAAEAAALFPTLPLLGPVPWPQGSGHPSTVMAWIGPAENSPAADGGPSDRLTPSDPQDSGLRQDPRDQEAALEGRGRPEPQGEDGEPGAGGGVGERSAVGGAKAVAGGPGRWQILRAGALMPLDLLPGVEPWQFSGPKS